MTRKKWWPFGRSKEKEPTTSDETRKSENGQEKFIDECKEEEKKKNGQGLKSCSLTEPSASAPDPFMESKNNLFEAIEAKSLEGVTVFFNLLESKGIHLSRPTFRKEFVKNSEQYQPGATTPTIPTPSSSKDSFSNSSSTFKLTSAVSLLSLLTRNNGRKTLHRGPLIESSAIHLAAECGDRKVFSFLLDRYRKGSVVFERYPPNILNERDFKGSTCLMLVVEGIHSELLEYLLVQEDLELGIQDNNEECDDPEWHGVSPFIHALKETSPKMANSFVKYRPQVLSSKNLEGKTPLIQLLASKSCENSIARLLDYQKGDLQVMELDERGISPLHYAVLYCDPSIIPLLLQNNAKIDCLDSSGRSPLHYAILFGTKALTIEGLLIGEEVKEFLHSNQFLSENDEFYLKSTFLISRGADFKSKDNFQKEIKDYVGSKVIEFMTTE